MSNNKNVTPLNLDILEMLSRTKGGALLFSKLGKKNKLFFSFAKTI